MTVWTAGGAKDVPAQELRRQIMDNSREHLSRVLISAEDIRKKIQETGAMISEKYAGKPLLIVCVLTGSFIFTADLCRTLSIPCEIDFMPVKSYSGDRSTWQVGIVLDLKKDISSYHVIIVEDIVDTGLTMKCVSSMLRERNPLSLSVVTLLDKPDRRKTDFTPDISLFRIPDVFVVGYGMDYDEHFRELPYVAEYRP